ncbi:transmembrane 9 superfamily member 8-like [Bidens hawaiensis]|uniref:transmembrane 9 superfamily member 8-like n=1 Tax=Bidens hawaiensis TaxID=980011 RepID=UPI00404A537E
MRVNTMCNIVCRVTLGEKTAKEFKEKINDEYRANMLLDDLPLVVPDSPPLYQLGYFVGGKARYANTTDDKYFINNHLSFVVSFHQNSEVPSGRIVGFNVKAFSVNHKYDGQWSHKTRLTTCDPRAKRLVDGSDPPQEVDDKKEIIFTYDVEFLETDIKWPSRWDTYLFLADDQIHWFSLVMIVLSMSGMVAMIMLRTLHGDIIDYDQLETLEEAQEQTCENLFK